MFVIKVSHQVFVACWKCSKLITCGWTVRHTRGVHVQDFRRV